MRNRKRNWIRHWILKRAVLGFAVAALALPAAAQARVDESKGVESNAPSRLVGPHDRGVTFDTSSTVSTPRVVSSSAFQWGDAGIGAGVVIGLVVLGGGVYVVARHLHKPQTA
jgi:hypothetical protein